MYIAEPFNETTLWRYIFLLLNVFGALVTFQVLRVLSRDDVRKPSLAKGFFQFRLNLKRRGNRIYSRAQSYYLSNLSVDVLDVGDFKA